jgi:hypothetical protein
MQRLKYSVIRKLYFDGRVENNEISQQFLLFFKVQFLESFRNKNNSS